MRKLILSVVTIFLCFSFSGCVSKADYKFLMDEYEHLKADYLNLAYENIVVNTTISGNFTVTVRELMPNYVLDDKTPMSAVVTSFQSAPFVLNLNEEIISQLEEGKIYTFEIEEKDVEVTKNQLEEAVFPDVAIPLFNLKIKSVTPAEETGLDCNNLKFAI